MTDKSPLVSVLMPVYNAERYLTEAIISILYQSFTDLELIAINDGSHDRSKDILEDFAAKDSRLRIINQPNAGIVAALNNGAAIARGTYLARMDADDISFLERIEKQIKALEKHPNAILVATGFEVIDENSEFMYREIVQTRDADIKRAMLLYNPLAHGSTMFRKDAFMAVGGYSDKCGPTEDYELWTRLAQRGEFIGLEDLLYKWRQNRKGITFTNNPAMQEYTAKNLAKYWSQSDIEIVSRADIIACGNYYLKNSKRYGPDTKNITYANIAQLGVKLIKNGRKWDGLKQLILLASTSRTGYKAAYYRVITIIRIQIRNTLARQKSSVGSDIEIDSIRN